MPATVLATPQKVAPASTKKSAKTQKKNDALKVAQSETEGYSDMVQDGDKTPSRKHRKHRKASNARKNGVQSDAGEFLNDSDGRRPSAHPPKHKMTPAKSIKSDAYAGPTFHQSPAASAIPLPSFMARSLPNTSGMPENIPPSRPETSQTQDKPRESTPLDWMFDAARTKSTPTVNNQMRVVSQTASPAPSPGQRKEEADFPFELDGDEDAKTAYTTPLAQRFMAAKTPQSSAEGSGPALTDQERQAKTAALKMALMNPVGVAGPPSASTPDQKLASPFHENPFNARNPTPARPSPPARHVSNPNSPYQNVNYNNYNSYNNYNTYNNAYNQQNQQYMNQYGASPSRNYNNQSNSRPPSSSLRNIYSPQPTGAPLSPPPSVADPRISTTRSPPPQRQLQYSSTFGAIYGQQRPSSEGTTTTSTNPTQDQKPSLERGLDDLRKVLNLTSLGQQN